MALILPDPNEPNIVNIQLSQEEMEDSPNSPIDNIRINRYMNIEKFDFLLKNQSIWFSRLDTFSDLHEGRAIIKWLNGDPDSDWWRKDVTASCWNVDGDENYSFWNIYIKSQLNSTYSYFVNFLYSLKILIYYLLFRKPLINNINGVCIVSTRDDFMNSIVDTSHSIQNFYVNYVSYGIIRDLVDPITCAVTKYDWYSYENEFRFLIHHGGEFEKRGEPVKLNLQILIKEIILSPNITDRAKKRIYQLCQTHGIKKTLIRDSSILDKLF